MPLTTFNSYNSLLFFVLLRENASTDDESTDIILLDPTHPYSHSLHKLDILAKTKQGTENTYCKSVFSYCIRLLYGLPSIASQRQSYFVYTYFSLL